MIRPLIILLVALTVSIAAQAVAVDEKPLADPAQEARARALMKEFRCLVCQNQSIEDSNAELARDLRMVVRERIALGDSADNVRAYMVDRYGDWVLLRPPLKLSTVFLWVSPFLVVLVIWFAYLGRDRRPAVAAPLSDEEAVRLAKLLGDRE